MPCMAPYDTALVCKSSTLQDLNSTVDFQPRVWKSTVELRSCNVELLHTSAVSYGAMQGIDLERADHGLPEDFAIVATVAARGLSQLVLRTDVAGMPLEWIDYKEAARLYTQEQVAYTCGSLLYELYGGTNARTGRRTVLEVNSIVATVGHTGNPGNTRHDYVPPLNNQTLFRRDAYLCMYCSQRFASRELSRDHIRPFSQGGTDIWTNVVAACRRCNNQKASRSEERRVGKECRSRWSPYH